MTNSMADKKSKRLDLQGIRGLAILSVLGFHFFPNFFPNGYLGVDQFFVLSGFLMCMLLKRSETLPIFSLITLFYSKRFKRILPLYLLVICCSLIALYTVFPDTAIETNTKSASKAILFISNRPKTDQEDYFQMLSIAVDIFTHTWSLSVEVQFYFIIPLFFVLINRFSIKYQILFYILAGLLSFLFYSFSDDIQAFNSVFARIWQFVIGMLVYLYCGDTLPRGNNKEYQPVNQSPDEEIGLIDEKNKILEVSEENIDEKSSTIQHTFSIKLKYIMFFLMLYFILNSTKIPAIFARPFMTISTALLMMVSIDDYILSNRLLTYFGDISYSLYLIHWPIYSYWKLTKDNNQFLLIFLLLLSIALAIIIFETFEKWYLQLSSTSIGVLVIFLLFFCVIMINYEELKNNIDPVKTRLDGVTENMTIDDAEKLNNNWNRDDMKNLKAASCQYHGGDGPLGWCTHKGLNKNSKYKIMLIGNSLCANHGKLLYQECGYKANYMVQGATCGCEPLYPTQFLDRCKKAVPDFQKHVADTKPDFVFLLTRFISIADPFPKNVTKMQDDPIYQYMKNQTNRLVKHIKTKLFIVDAYPQIKGHEVGNIVPKIRANKTFEQIDKEIYYDGNYEMARARHAQLIKDCGGKCELIDYLNDFYNNSTKTFRYFDERGFSYFTYVNHFSPHGLERIRHHYHDICKKL